MDELWRILPIVAGAAVAGLSAVVKSLYERRDNRLTAHRQLELASKRTEFVSGWLEVCRSVAGDDAEFAASATTRARAELEEAYEEAQHALANSRSALSRSGRPTLGQELAHVLMLRRRRRMASYAAVAVFYVVVISLWAVSLTPDPKFVDGTPNEDYVPWWQYLIVAVVSTLVFRFVAGVLVGWLEGRGTRAAPPAPTAAIRPPAPVTIDATDGQSETARSADATTS